METASGKHRLCHLNRELLVLKAVYFTFIAACGALLPFIPIYMKQIGLSSTETGVIVGCMPFLAFLVKPLFGLVADKTRRHRLVLIICCVMNGVCYCLLLLTPAKVGLERRVRIHTRLECGPQFVVIKDCERNHGIDQEQVRDKQDCSSIFNLQFFYQRVNRNKTHKCEASCSTDKNGTRLNVDVCFMDNVTSTGTKVCKKRWNDSITTSFNFYINDLNYLMRSVENHTSPDDSQCQIYRVRNVTYDHQIFWQFTCVSDTLMTCTLECTAGETDSICLNQEGKFDRTFWIFLVIFLFSNIFFAPVGSLLDAIAYDILGENRGRWGMQILWGTVGFALFAIVSTFIMDLISESKTSVNYTISFYIYLGLCVLSGLIVGFIKFDKNLQCNQVLKNIKDLLKIPQLVFFLTMMMFYGMMHMAIEGFLFWYLEDLGSTQIVLGLDLVCCSVPEIISLFFSGHVIKKIGHVNCFYLSATAYIVRFFCYSTLTNPWYVLPVEPLHSLTFGLFYAAASSYISVITPPGMSGTTQGLLAGIYFGLARGFGSIITGRLFDPIKGVGPVWTFRVCGMFALFVLILHVLVQTIFFRRTRPKLPQQNQGNDELTDQVLLGQIEEVTSNLHK